MERNCIRWSGHDCGVEAVEVMPDGNRAVSIAYDDTIRVWDLGLGREIHCLSCKPSSVTSRDIWFPRMVKELWPQMATQSWCGR